MADLDELVARGDLILLAPVLDTGTHGLPQRALLDAREEAFDHAELDVCFAPVNTLLEATVDPNVGARSLLLHDSEGRPHLAPAIRFAEEPAAPRLRAPLLGEHTDEVLTELEAEAGEW